MQLIPDNTITIIGASATLCFILPLLVLIAYKKNSRASMRPCVYGILIFFSFAMGLESIVHMLCLGVDSPVSRFLASSPWAYALYGALMAGLFEETGRFLAFHLLKQDYPKKTTAIMYGIGHAGTETIMIGAISLLNLMIVAVSFNGMGAEAFYESMGDMAASTQATVESLMTSTPAIYFLSVLERMTAFVLQISLSVFVYTAVMKKEQRYLFPVAIVLHTLIDIFAALYQTGVITNLYLLEGIVVLYTAVVTFFAVKLFRKLE